MYERAEGRTAVTARQIALLVLSLKSSHRHYVKQPAGGGAER